MGSCEESAWHIEGECSIEEITDLPTHVAVKKEGIQKGVIAQEYQQAFPNRVKEQTTGVLTVNTDDTIWDLVNAVKELNGRLTRLENK